MDFEDKILNINGKLVGKNSIREIITGILNRYIDKTKYNGGFYEIAA